MGMIVLAAYLILTGVFALVPQTGFSGQGVLMAVLALIAGILILVGR